MDKRVLALGLAILILPIAIALWPRPLTFQRLRDRLERQNLTVKDVKSIGSPAHGATQEVRFTVNEAVVQLFHFDDKQKLEACHQLYRDPTKARQALSRLLSQGVPLDLRAPTVTARNQWYVLTVTTDNDALRDAILVVFRRL